jgi:hypothetical protein
MSSNASEARRLRPDRRKRSKDHDISNHRYTSWDEQALHTLIQMSNAKVQKTTTSRIISTRVGTCKLYTLIQMSL